MASTINIWRRLRNRLGVSLISRGNHLAIMGPSDSANVARLALDALYRKLTRGHSVDAAEVDAAVRMANGGLDLASDDQPTINPQETYHAAFANAGAVY